MRPGSESDVERSCRASAGGVRRCLTDTSLGLCSRLVTFEWPVHSIAEPDGSSSTMAGSYALPVFALGQGVGRGVMSPLMTTFSRSCSSISIA